MITIILRDPRLAPLLPQAVRCKSPLGCLRYRSRPLAGGGMSLPYNGNHNIPK